MEFLESAMAFAVAMILFSTIATGIVEFLFRILAVRERTLSHTVETLFDAVIWPRLQARIAETAEAKKAARELFVRDMTGNPGKKGVFDGQKSVTRKSLVHAQRIDNLTVLAFAERLGRSDVGRAILAEGEAQFELLVKDFVRTYDRFGRAAQEVYRKNANAAAILIGILLAFGGNIDAGRLLNTLVENPDLRTTLVADAASVAKANETAVKSLDVVQKLAAENKLPEDQADAIKKQTTDLIASLNTVKSRGLPVGWGYFPYCGGNEATPQRMCDAKTGRASMSPGTYLWEVVRWFLLTALAGFLIGLGGPFWFRVFTGLSQVAQMLRSVGIGTKKAPPATADQPAATPAEESAKPKDVVDAFRTAATVSHGATISTERVILGPDGRPI